ncbi:hypothetical protein IscW_ISCW012792 [Ixodes scapularis]|uniref:Uncharacterized protein n=1 Tax=Ixodes scapularis TaxID=6945 RepID=B7QA24_IXOSC|nr:hypothetical protein IscW_ISCW012792 [Ixodes scapularis]|eukprot:XP_002399780.1 hypothetical protein IscW_ISCW012792 [Ixodes scapularis]
MARQLVGGSHLGDEPLVELQVLGGDSATPDVGLLVKRKGALQRVLRENVGPDVDDRRHLGGDGFTLPWQGGSP